MDGVVTGQNIARHSVINTLFASGMSIQGGTRGKFYIAK